MNALWKLLKPNSDDAIFVGGILWAWGFKAIADGNFWIAGGLIFLGFCGYAGGKVWRSIGEGRNA